MDEETIESIKDMIANMDYDKLTHDQHMLIVSFEDQFIKNNYLSDRQITILEQIWECNNRR